ncbi:MAG: hypothetical protein ACI8QF_003087, partial [Limisphaerales bacterium]
SIICLVSSTRVAQFAALLLTMGSLTQNAIWRRQRLKAAEDSRTPRPVGIRTSIRLRDSVVECGCPLPLLVIILSG